MSISTQYNPTDIEEKWYNYWLQHNLFKSVPDEREPYTIVIPPPNVTGQLHLGHTLNNTLQDALIRRARLLGKNACWVPGTDHASIATENKVLEFLNCSRNQITSLDISINTALVGLYSNYNQLTSLNLKNGNNANFQLLYLNLTNNPNLSCIQVDDKAYSDANWSTKKDATASYNTNCTNLYTDIPDSNFDLSVVFKTPNTETVRSLFSIDFPTNCTLELNCSSLASGTLKVIF